MVILQVNALLGIGSTGRTVLELANALNNNGNVCYVAYAVGSTNYKNSYRIGNAFDHKMHALLSRITGLQGYFSVLQTKKFIHYINKIQPDIVHLNNLHNNYINLPKLLKFLANKNYRTVLTMHDCWFYTGKCCHYSDCNCEKWKTRCNKCQQVHSGNISWIFDWSTKMFQDKKKYFNNIKKLGIIGVSNWVTSEAKLSFLKDSCCIDTIYNWIDTNVFYPRALELNKIKLNYKNKFICLGVATKWGDKKGFFDFIELSKLLKNDEVIILIGEMTDQTLTLPKNIILIKNTEDQNELAEYYSAADVFVNPSKRETFGKVTAEALACGTPCIVYNTTGCSELIHENCGYVVELNNVVQLHEKIEIIKEKGKQSYSKDCTQFAHENFDYYKNTLKYEHFYQKLMEL